MRAGERPFQCDEADCSYATADSGALTRHMRTHTGEKPALCCWAGCDFAASDHSNLARHTKTHLGERPFPCPEPGCTYAASQKGTLASHKRRLHTARSRDIPCMGAGCAASHLGDMRSHAKRCKRLASGAVASHDFIKDVNLLPRLDCVDGGLGMGCDALVAEASTYLMKLLQESAAVQEQQQHQHQPDALTCTVTCDRAQRRSERALATHEPM